MITPQSRRGYLGNIFGIVGAAINASAAVEVRRTPKERDLRTLGIEPASFPNIRNI
jgi:hypothetical protein